MSAPKQDNIWLRMFLTMIKDWPIAEGLMKLPKAAKAAKATVASEVAQAMVSDKVLEHHFDQT